MDEEGEVFADEVDSVDNLFGFNALRSPALRGLRQRRVVNKEGGKRES